MKYDPNKHHRRSIRLKGYDYAQVGAYFVTIVTQDRACLFGEVVDNEICLNEAGQMVQAVWDELKVFYPGVQTDAFVVMPNHVHGIIILTGQTAVGAGPRACPLGQPQGVAPTIGQPQGVAPTIGQPQGVAPTIGQPQGVAPTIGQPQGVAPTIGQPQGVAPTIGQPQGVAPTLALSDVVHRFKTMTTKRYADGVKQRGWLPFRHRLWQRNYYDHIIRDESSLNRIRQYILDNPIRWQMDRENPDAAQWEPKEAWWA